MNCPSCGGEGHVYKSRYGGNDPDVWEVTCESCDGSGGQECERRDCHAYAVGRNGDGEALCLGCLVEWAEAQSLEIEVEKARVT